jgi:predicted nucleic acid-binding protein
MRFLDTNVLVYFLLDDRVNGKVAARIVDRIDRGEEVVVPLAVLKELSYFMLARGERPGRVAEIVLRLARPNVTIMADDYPAFIEGLGVAERYRVDLADGIMVSLMRRSGEAEIYSRDEGFDRIPGIERVFA